MGRDSYKDAFEKRIRKALNLLSTVYAADRYALKRKIYRIRRLKPNHDFENGDFNNDTFKKLETRLTHLEQEISVSVRRRTWRQHHCPDVAYPNNDLPILAKKDEIISAIKKHAVVIISGDTGSGKTTQIPKFCLEASRGIDGIIGCTQPRRIAATTVARRIAQEMGQTLGDAVGYKIRFRDQTSNNGFIKIMTDGILLAELQGDPFLNQYDTLIVDEAHERSLNIDLSLGIIKQLITRRKNLKLIITSATIDTEKFSKSFNGAPIIEVSGRMFPVEIRYESPESMKEQADASPVELAVAAVMRLMQKSRRGDILIFMPTEQDIRDTCQLLDGQAGPNVTILPLFARLAGPEQSKVFAKFKGRKIIVATNVAETSITIPGIKYVVDTGLARISRYTPRSRCTLLPIESISKSSADQRKGRCGRVADGVCVRLYTEEDYLARPLFTAPEVLRANLGHVILQMIAFRLGDVAGFPFIDSPPTKSISDGYQLLSELGAISGPHEGDKPKRNRYRLTADGKKMARLPIDPRLSRILIEAGRQGCLAEITVIAAVLSIQDPRERPLDKQDEADLAHEGWTDKRSDFISFLNIWRWYQAALAKGEGVRKMKRLCQRHFLSYRRMREWEDIYRQLKSVLKEFGTPVGALPDADILSDTPAGKFSPRYTAMHRSILSGFLSNIACKKEKNIFMGAGGREVMIFPGSGLFNRASKWVVAAEWVLTSRLFARCVARIDPDWLESLGKELCQSTVTDPHWDRSAKTVMAHEQVTLYGLVIIPRRRVVYGRINAEKACHIFIEDALVPVNIDQHFSFIDHNQALIDEVKGLEDRLRRRDLFMGNDAVADFYRRHLKGVWNIHLLKKKIQAKGGERFLYLQREALLRYFPEQSLLAGFPDSIPLGQGNYPCSYVYHPGDPADGVTVKIPAGAVATVPMGAVDWLVPGLIAEKIKALIKGLPKIYRRRLGPVPQVVEKIAQKLPSEKNRGQKDRGPLINVLGELIQQLFGVHIPATGWAPDELPNYLKMRISVSDIKGREIKSSRNPAILRQMFAIDIDSTHMAACKQRWERTKITIWDFESIPDTINLSYTKAADGVAESRWVAYPALTDESDGESAKSIGVSLRIYATYDTAIRAHLQGVKRLAMIQLAKEVKHLKKIVKVPGKISAKTAYFGGPTTVERQVFEKVLSDLFEKNIRNKKAFNANLNTYGPQLYQTGKAYMAAVANVIETMHHSRLRLSQWQSQHLANTSIYQYVGRRLTDLDRLIPTNFITLYDNDRLVNLPYFIEAILIRSQRGIVDLQKDRRKVEKVRLFSEQLNETLSLLSPTTSKMKREAVEALFWQLETYKVSVFAQELKGLPPVSAKQLKEKLDQIERMV